MEVQNRASEPRGAALVLRHYVRMHFLFAASIASPVLRGELAINSRLVWREGGIIIRERRILSFHLGAWSYSY